MKQPLSQADIRQTRKEGCAVFGAKCFPAAPEPNQPLFPRVEFKSPMQALTATPQPLARQNMAIPHAAMWTEMFVAFLV